MKKTLSIICFLIINLTIKAQINDPNAPVFKFNEETHDFGNIKEGPIATFDFTFINTGKTPLLIQSCSASCGCTTPDWSKEPIKPGQKGKISVKYTSQGHPGTFNKSVYITSNAQCDKKKYELYIKGNVVPSAETTNVEQAKKAASTPIIPVKH
jgi:hypothetical protein